MRRPLPSRFAHELYLPPVDPLQPLALHHHDHQPLLQKNHQPDQQPARLDPRA